jgi:hypothetical protein
MWLRIQEGQFVPRKGKTICFKSFSLEDWKLLLEHGNIHGGLKRQLFYEMQMEFLRKSLNLNMNIAFILTLKAATI